MIFFVSKARVPLEKERGGLFGKFFPKFEKGRVPSGRGVVAIIHTCIHIEFSKSKKGRVPFGGGVGKAGYLWQRGGMAGPGTFFSFHASLYIQKSYLFVYMIIVVTRLQGVL
jgi:hypothetical protein